MPPTLALMLKAPVPGEVKTRLGREIGFEKAAQVYRLLVEHQLRQLPAHWPRHVYYAPATALETMRTWLGDSLSYHAQSGGDLGARLTAAMHRHFGESNAPLCFIAGDCPYLGSEHFETVARRLESHD